MGRGRTVLGFPVPGLQDIDQTLDPKLHITRWQPWLTSCQGQLSLGFRTSRTKGLGFRVYCGSNDLYPISEKCICYHTLLSGLRLRERL